MLLVLLLACLCLPAVSPSSVCNLRCGAGQTDRFCRLFCNSDQEDEEPGTRAPRLQDIRLPDGKIIGGYQAHVGQFPFAASLRLRSRSSPWHFGSHFYHYCGGVIVSNQTVLTAAHCVHPMDGRPIYVSVGGHRLSQLDNGEQIILVRKIIKHPRFNPDTFENDIAVLHLTSPFTPSSTIQPVAINPNPRLLEKLAREEEDLTVLGWGVVVEDGDEHSEILRYVDVPYVKREDCQDQMWPYLVDEGMICAGDVKNGGVDACQGDSGGPIVYWRESITRSDRRGLPPPEVKSRLKAGNGKLFWPWRFRTTTPVPNRSVPQVNSGEGEWVLTGLVSWGIGCGNPGLPGIYTNFLNYMDWVDNNMNIS